MIDGAMKIPDPIIEPTMSVAAENVPSRRSSFDPSPSIGRHPTRAAVECGAGRRGPIQCFADGRSWTRKIAGGKSSGLTVVGPCEPAGEDVEGGDAIVVTDELGSSGSSRRT